MAAAMSGVRAKRREVTSAHCQISLSCEIDVAKRKYEVLRHRHRFGIRCGFLPALTHARNQLIFAKSE